MPSPVELTGLRDLSRSFSKLGKDADGVLKSELVQVGVPVQRAAETLAVQRIHHIGPRWSLMRVGVTRSSVYVAPKQRRSRRNSRRARPNLANLLMDKAMAPALDQQSPNVERALNRALDRLAGDWAA